VLKPAVDVDAAREQFRKEREKMLADQPESPQALTPLFDRYFLDWDDDAGAGYAARPQLVIPADGDYRLVLGSTPLRPTFGDYRLLLGLDAPEVLGGKAAATGDNLARLMQAVWQGARRVQEVSGTLPGQEFTTVELQRIFSEETLASFWRFPGAAAPELVLYDYGDKPLVEAPAGAPGGGLRSSTPLPRKDERPRLKLKRPPGTEKAAIDFRLLVGVNAADVLTTARKGKPSCGRYPGRDRPAHGPDHRGRPALGELRGGRQPAPQVAGLQACFRSAELQVPPEDFQREAFPQFVQARDTNWPDFVLFNQQGNRWSQKRSPPSTRTDG
jgi:hypothetical protein